jgi:uncharacterized protein involved in outer membrane biogenesis
MRTFFTSLAGLIVVIILVIALVIFIGWSRVPDIVANHLSKKLKVFVEIGSMHLGWGQIGVNKMQIGNPPGAVQAQAFKCSEIDIHVPITAFFKDQVMIDEIDVNNVFLDLEFDSASGTQGNWSKIMGNLQESSANEAKSSSSKNGKKSQNTKSVYIKKLTLTNIDVDVVYIKEGGKVIHLPRIDQIQLYDISSEGGLPMDQIMNSVLGQMLKSVFQKQNLKNMLQNLIENPPSSIQKYLSPFKGLFQSRPIKEDETAPILSRHA